MHRDKDNKLQKGNYYPFTFYKKITFEDEEYWVCIDPFGKKHMLNAEWYASYKFEAGKEYACRIDKINCTGQLFIEPEHPFYKEGRNYTFTVEGITLWQNSFGHDETHLDLTAPLGEKAEITFLGKQDFQPGQPIELNLFRIQKGKLLLFPPAGKTDYSYLVPGEEYFFTILSEIELFPEKNYYILSDEKGNKHYLRKKYYKSFHFKQGQKIKCRVLDEPSPGSHYLEPEYPDYERGKVYDFVFLREGEYYFSEFGKRDVFFVADMKDRECIMIYQSDTKPDVSDGFIKAKVLYNFRGQLFLQAPNLGDMVNESFLD